MIVDSTTAKDNLTSPFTNLINELSTLKLFKWFITNLPRASSEIQVNKWHFPPSFVRATAIFADDPPKCETKFLALSVLVPGGSGYISIPALPLLKIYFL